jgi:hypothetical protein
MRPQDLRALRARAFATRPKTPWLLVAFEWALEQIHKAPRPLRMPLLFLVMVGAEFLPVRLLLMQEMLNDRLYPEPAQS